MYTSHGHHIPGTALEELRQNPFRARCGGPRMCVICAREVAQALELAGPLMDVRVNWVVEGQLPQTGVFGLISDEKVLAEAKRQVDEPHLWFVARDGRIFGIPSKDVLSIMAMRGG